MFTRTRLRFIFLLSMCILQTTGRSQDQYSLDQLLADYKSYGLPLPPEGSELAILPGPDVSITNGVRHQDMYLVLLTKKASPSSKAIYWVGCAEGWQWQRIEFKKAPPISDGLKNTHPVPFDYQRNAFVTYPDLALAIQCHAMGWKEFAAALLKRSLLDQKSDSSKRLKPRPQDDRAALAKLAWLHYCNRFAVAERAERSIIVIKLKFLMSTPFKLNSVAHRSIVADMEKTLVRVQAIPNSLEAAIEGLLESKERRGFIGTGFRPRRLGNSDDPNYIQLQNAGWDAVPILVQHVNDFRLTRTIHVNREASYAWNTRIADIVSELLYSIANEPITYDFLEKEGRGASLDRRHVEHWWKEVSTENELDYLLKTMAQSFESSNADSIRPMLRIMSKKYPNDFVKLFEKKQNRHKLDSNWFDELENCKFSLSEKLRLIMVSVNSKDSWEKTYALRSLANFDNPETARFIIEVLEQLPKTPSVPYWQSEIVNYSQIAFGLDNDDVWKALLSTARRVDMGQRMQMIGTFSMQKTDTMKHRAIPFLREFLKDTEGRKGRQLEGLFSGPMAGFMHDNIRVCDLAAEQLASLLDINESPDSTWNKADWDKFRARVEAELAKRPQGQDPKGGK